MNAKSAENFARKKIEIENATARLDAKVVGMLWKCGLSCRNDLGNASIGSVGRTTIDLVAIVGTLIERIEKLENAKG